MPNDGAKFIDVIAGARLAGGVGVDGAVGVDGVEFDEPPELPPQPAMSTYERRRPDRAANFRISDLPVNEPESAA
jgi:hypothetical protein